MAIMTITSTGIMMSATDVISFERKDSPRYRIWARDLIVGRRLLFHNVMIPGGLGP